MVRKYKKDSEVSYTLGATVTMELLNKRADCARAVYVSPKSDISAAVERARELGVPVTESERAFNILADKDNCFVIGEFVKFVPHASTESNHIVLVNPSNSGNLGTIMRAVAAFDCADLIIITPSVDPFDPKTVRASMGAVFDIRFELFDSFDAYIKKYGDNREIVPFMLDGAPFADKMFERDGKYALVFGNEATGLDASFKGYGAVRIEQSEKVDSLNLSVAAAIALYKLKVGMRA